MHAKENGTLRDTVLQGMSLAACTVNVVTTDGHGGRAGATLAQPNTTIPATL